MDPLGPIDLATAAASAVGAYLARFASGVLDRASDDASERLYQYVSSRLQTSRLGTNVLKRLQKEPNDGAHQEAMALALADEVERDPQFGAALAALVHGGPHVAVASGDANIVNTGSWTNQRGIVATGGATINQSRQYRISTGGVWLLLVIFVLLSGTATTAIVINKNTPAYPELEGTWRYEDDYGSRMVIHVEDDRFAIDAVGMLQQVQCEGRVSAQKDRTYVLASSQGICPETTVVLEEDGESLRYYDTDGDSLVFTK